MLQLAKSNVFRTVVCDLKKSKIVSVHCLSLICASSKQSIYSWFSPELAEYFRCSYSTDIFSWNDTVSLGVVLALSHQVLVRDAGDIVAKSGFADDLARYTWGSHWPADLCGLNSLEVCVCHTTCDSNGALVASDYYRSFLNSVVTCVWQIKCYFLIAEIKDCVRKLIKYIFMTCETKWDFFEYKVAKQKWI